MLTSLQKIRCACLVALTHNLALPVLKHVRKVRPFPYSREQLLAMEKGTVGRDLADFLGNKQLDLLSHYARHDMKHVVLGYDTTEEGELCLQSFMLGNGRVSFPVLATVLFGVFTSPEHWHNMRLAYQKGKSCYPIHQWNWFALVPLDTLQLRNHIYQSKKHIA
ncbi:MAG: hypothetical protein V4450_16085 [Bacteroidota bacterium]